jgi:hypothetical protein
MYEIWLMLNIVWELAATVWPALLVLALTWLLLVTLALRRRARSPIRAALGVALAGGLLAIVGVPALTQSSIGEARYLPDWLVLSGIAAAAALAAFAFALPLLRLLLPVSARRG